MKKLSVIVCVHNTDESLFKCCLNSIFASTLKDIEVIVVDDGSTKNYESVLKKFDVKYFKTENRGTLSARIYGVKLSTCPYVCFVDSDDTISFNYLEGSLNSISDADIVINDWAFDTNSTKYYCLNDSSINSNFVSHEPLKKYFSQQGKEHSTYVLWNKIFKREIILSACAEVEKLNIQYLVYAEDVLLTYFAYAFAKKILNTHVGYYFYRVHSSQQVTVQSKEKLCGHVVAITDVFNLIEQDLKEKKVFENYQTDFQNWKQLLCSTNYTIAKNYKSQELNDFIKEKFKNCKLKKVGFFSDYAYSNQKVFPVNIEEIDKYLQKVFYSNKFFKVFVKKNSYAYKELIKMKKIFDLNFIFSTRKDANLLFPKEKNSFKQKLIHNTFIFKIGVLLFPKGSKVRAFLKRKL